MLGVAVLTRPRPACSAAARVGRDWVSVLRGWIANRRARQELWRCASLDRRFARDVGLTDSEVARECDAPFWVAVGHPSQRHPALDLSRRKEQQ